MKDEEIKGVPEHDSFDPYWVNELPMDEFDEEIESWGDENIKLYEL